MKDGAAAWHTHGRGSLLVVASLAVAGAWAASGCYPNPDDLRPRGSSSGGSGGTPGNGGTSGSAGAGGGGVSGGTGGHTGTGGTTGTGVGGTGAGGATTPATGGRTGAGGTTTPGTGGVTGTGGMNATGGRPGAGGYAGAGLVLTPDATGWIDKSTNAYGVQGGWYGFSDGVGANGQTAGGACELAGHPAVTCSMLTMPSPTATGFPNTGGRMCAVGVAARVLNNAVSGKADFGAMYGAAIAFDFNYNSTTMTKGIFNAQAVGLTGIQFDIDVVPANGMHIQMINPGTDLGFGGPPYWGADPTFPQSPVHVGTNRIYWADFAGPDGLGLDPTQLQSMSFGVLTQTATSSNFSFCISNVTLMKDPDPLGRACTSPTFPVFCPGRNGALDDCWNSGVNCNSVVDCPDNSHACFGQAPSQYYDCTMHMCLTCSAPDPQACPALGTVPAGCWADGVFCDTVTDCGGGQYFGCLDSTKFVDCTTDTCF